MTRFIIKKSDIINNFNEISRVSNALVIPVLKADCYGLGALAVMELLQAECGTSLFAVSRLSEALPLCGRGADILVMSCCHDEQSQKAIVDNDLIATVDSLGQARRLAQYALSSEKIARVHIKIDTGFGRFGFMPDNLSDIMAVYSLEGLRAEGIFSHFSDSFCDSTDITDKQFSDFCALLDALSENGIKTGIRHIANSCAAVRGTKYALDAVRVGSALLGRLPMKSELDLKRVGCFETDICDIRHLKKGANIGYGNVYRLKRDTRTAVLCVGSADGVLISKAYDTFRLIDILRYGFGVFKMLFRDNRPIVRVNGVPARVIGRVALTHTIIDVTGIDCKCGDTVTMDISPLCLGQAVERVYI